MFTADSFVTWFVSRFLSHKKEVSLTPKNFSPFTLTWEATSCDTVLPGEASTSSFQDFAPTQLSSLADLSECGLPGIMLVLLPTRCLRNSKCYQERHDYHMVPLLSPQTVKWEPTFKPQLAHRTECESDTQQKLVRSFPECTCLSYRAVGNLWWLQNSLGSGNRADINTPSSNHVSINCTPFNLSFLCFAVKFSPSVSSEGKDWHIWVSSAILHCLPSLDFEGQSIGHNLEGVRPSRI